MWFPSSFRALLTLTLNMQLRLAVAAPQAQPPPRQSGPRAQQAPEPKAGTSAPPPSSPEATELWGSDTFDGTSQASSISLVSVSSASSTASLHSLAAEPPAPLGASPLYLGALLAVAAPLASAHEPEQAAGPAPAQLPPAEQPAVGLDAQPQSETPQQVASQPPQQVAPRKPHQVATHVPQQSAVHTYVPQCVFQARERAHRCGRCGTGGQLYKTCPFNPRTKKK